MFLLLWILGFVFANEPAIEPVKLSYEELPELIRKRNEHAKSAQWSTEASQTREGHLFRSFLPKLNARIGGEHFNTGTFSTTTQHFADVSAELNLFRGGKDALEDSIREQQTFIKRSEAESTIAIEITKARRSYWSLVFQNEISALLEEALKRNDETLAGAKKRLSAGLGTETDRTEFEIQKTNLEQDLARSTLEKKNADRSLKILVGIETQAPLLVDITIPHQHEDALLTENLKSQNHREIKLLSAQQQLSDLSHTIHARWWIPSLDVYAAYGLFTLREKEYLNQSDRLEAVVGAQLKFQFFDGGESLTEARANSQEALALELKTNQSQKELAASYQGSKDELNLLHELIHGAEKNVDQAKSYLNGTLSEYRRGLKNSPDVVGANLRYMDAMKRWIELRRDYQFAKIDLMEVLGK